MSQWLANRSATVGLAIILILCFIALFAPQLAPHQYAEQDILNSLAPPLSPDHLLGTDQFGRDVLSRILWGARVSIQVGLVVTSISMLIGLVVGSLAGYCGGMVDVALSNCIDLIWAFPLVLVALLLVTVLGPGLTGVMLATGLVAWSGFARIVRGEIVSLRERGFVLAARTLGAGDGRIILRHILPNIAGPVLVIASFTMAAAVVIESSLSFLGLGAQPPMPSWGTMLNDGRAVLYRAPWLAVFPSCAIALLVLGFNLLGDGLRDVLDPQARRR